MGRQRSSERLLSSQEREQSDTLKSIGALKVDGTSWVWGWEVISEQLCVVGDQETHPGESGSHWWVLLFSLFSRVYWSKAHVWIDQ